MLGSIASVAKERLSASGVGGQVGGGSAATGAERLSLELVDRECREAIRQSKEQLAALKTGTEPLQVREEMDQIVRRVVQLLRQRAEEARG